MFELILTTYLSISPPPGCGRTEPPNCEPRQRQITSVLVQNHQTIKIMTPNNAIATALTSRFGTDLSNMPSALLLELQQNAQALRLGMGFEMLPHSANLAPYYRALDDQDTASIAEMEDWLSEVIRNRQDITDTIHQMIGDLTTNN